MTKVYVLQEIGWEYNDEVNYRPESDGGIARKVFKNKDKADEECAKLNLDFFRHNSPAEFSYGDWYEVSSMDEDEALDILNKTFPNDQIGEIQELFETYWHPQNISDEQLAVMVKVFNKLGACEVIEVDYE